MRVEVNQGPSAIFEAFLGNPSQFDAASVAALRMAMRRFLEACRDGLRRDDALIRMCFSSVLCVHFCAHAILCAEDNQRPFHRELEIGFSQLQAFCEKFMDPAR